MKMKSMRLVSAMLALVLVFGVISVSFVETAAVSGYYQTSKDNVPVWSRSSSTSPSVKLRTIAAKGTVVKVSSTLTNSSGTWAKLNTGEFISMSNLVVHTHTYSNAQTKYTYEKKSNTQHVKITHSIVKCTGIACSYIKSDSIVKKVNESHSFSGSNCTKCGQIKIPSTAGTYYTKSDKTPVYSAATSSATIIRYLSKNTRVVVISVLINSAGNYWGKIGGGKYIYMGNFVVGGIGSGGSGGGGVGVW